MLNPEDKISIHIALIVISLLNKSLLISDFSHLGSDPGVSYISSLVCAISIE